MKTIENFCGQKNGYSRSITLRNALIPIGKTEENIQKFELLKNDFKRANAYGEIKNLIDDFHRSFIEDVLSKASFEWGPLYDQFELFQKEADRQKKDKHKKELESLQSAMRKQIVKKFTADERFKKLFAKELLSDLLPEIIREDESGNISDKEEALKVFDKFSTYFTGFHENRKNLYSDEAKATAISNRIVNENFPKFFANVQVFKKLEKDFPQIVSDTEKSLAKHLRGKKLFDIFNPEGFNAVLSQSGIDFYNTVIGGVSGEAGSEKTKGLNEHINLVRQQLQDEQKKNLRGKMTVLFKQILSDRESASFIPVGFEASREVYESVKTFKENVLDKVISDTKDLFAQSKDFNLEQIFVPAKENTAFSQTLFGHWSVLREGAIAIERKKSQKELSSAKEEKLAKEIEKKDFSLAEIQRLYESYCAENDKEDKSRLVSVCDYFAFRGTSDNEPKELNLLEQISESYKKINFAEQKDLQQEKEAATPIKDFLDSAQNLYHYLKLVDYKGEEEKDSAFYARYSEILESLAEVIPLYNKTRNFVTKKPGEVKKIKLNFDCSSFLSGWGTEFGTKESHIFIDENKYYLGIVNSKLDKNDVANLKSKTGNTVKWVIYDFQKPDNKNTPRLFIRSKGDSYAPAVSKYHLPIESIIDIYDKGLFKTEYRNINQSVYKDSLVKMIDYFKLGFSRHDSYKHYNFCWKDSDKYNDISEFYSDTIKSCYQIKFENVSKDILLELVNQGKLFLFQIYNKDFSEKSDGEKNLHTLYFENLFSEENLKDVVLELNGKAELFFRPANDRLKIHVHKKDSILVNRTASDGSTIPEELYQEIYQFKNGFASSLSDKAKELLDSGKVVCKKASHDIIKDRHFTKNTYLFHCPITMNFKAAEITGKKFNTRVLEYLKDNPDVKIIGLDRGERHLIYLSLINQKGEIEMQKTLNIVNQVRNGKTVSVNYQEKLVQKEGERGTARKNWQTIGNIKELKEGYLSNIVHEIASLMVQHNAIVVMEDLNFGFKRGRFAVERQVYQKFEQMLIDKLNYLVFKDRGVSEAGGVLNAYQLTDKFTAFKDLGKQCGWLFYIPAGYTSKIDPKTGFANLFVTKGLTNVEKKKDFFDRFDSIRYDSKTDGFVFAFDYDNFGANALHDKDFQKKWEVNTRGERIVFSKTDRKSVSVSPTEELKIIFDTFGIKWNSGENFIDSVQEIQAEKANAKFFDTLLRSFNATLQMRNSIPNSEIDYLVSPVVASDGTFFDSREQKALEENGIAKLPVDADANGAYHIALKGLYLLKNSFNLNDKDYIENIKDADWFKFAQEKKYAE
ncbi:MAG: type V CRISPR-associated protein Cas12a/Cpf1 [Treponema sp.]|nr:type V CRISPR-associated protein Cas12a/Cpf1 [Treponema sp.]MBO6219416.1 type V CRISPR-associated protein Cas12a/Cpf1 [Treponema sp.]